MRRKQRLRVLLKILISLFIIFSAAALLLAGIRKSRIEARERQAAMEALKNAPTKTPTITVSVTPSPTPRPTATPTPVPTVVAAFDPDNFWDYWYSTDGTATINVYDISLDRISFSFYQTDRAQTQSVSADITAEVAGNAAAFSFSDSAGNQASGNIVFDNGQFYVKIATGEPGQLCISECELHHEPGTDISSAGSDGNACAGEYGTDQYTDRRILFPGQCRPLSDR